MSLQVVPQIVLLSFMMLILSLDEAQASTSVSVSDSVSSCLDSYKKIKRIMITETAKVIKAEDKITKAFVAIKVFNDNDAFLKENGVVTLLKERVEQYSFYVAKHGECFWPKPKRSAIVYEWVDHKFPQPGLTKSNPPEIMLNYAHQMLDALVKLQDAGVLHLDLKPLNLGLSADGTVKLFDLGESMFQEDYHGKYVGGTMEFDSPEKIAEVDIGEEAFKIDVWAVGCTIYNMFSGAYFAKNLYDYVKCVTDNVDDDEFHRCKLLAELKYAEKYSCFDGSDSPKCDGIYEIPAETEDICASYKKCGGHTKSDLQFDAKITGLLWR